MTYLNWGCDPLAEECGSCLDALCNACFSEFRETARDTGGSGTGPGDTGEPDCDRCDLEKKPDCGHCQVVLKICRDCPENRTCGFRISG